MPLVGGVPSRTLHLFLSFYVGVLRSLAKAAHFTADHVPNLYFPSVNYNLSAFKRMVQYTKTYCESYILIISSTKEAKKKQSIHRTSSLNLYGKNLRVCSS